MGSSRGIRVALAFGGLIAIVVLVVFVLRLTGPATGRVSAKEIRLTLPISYANGAYCVSNGDVCLTPASVAEGVAFYAFDTHDVFRSQGCHVKWTELTPGAISDPATGAPVTWAFRSGCSGATFDATGRWLFGPANGDLETFPVTQQGSQILIDTAELTCDAGHVLTGCVAVRQPAGGAGTPIAANRVP